MVMNMDIDMEIGDLTMAQMSANATCFYSADCVLQKDFCD